MVSPFQGIAQGIVNLGSHFSNILSYINPFSDNFILKNTDNFLGNIFDRLNPFSDNFILKDVLSFLGNLVSYVNPFSENFLGKKLIELISDLFEDLFIPTGNQFEEFYNKFNNKFGFVSQIVEIAKTLFNTSSGATVPNWEITWQGATFNFFDFDFFNKYRGTLHTVIIAVCYISFIFRLFKRLPAIIGAYTDK